LNGWKSNSKLTAMGQRGTGPAAGASPGRHDGGIGNRRFEPLAFAAIGGGDEALRLSLGSVRQPIAQALEAPGLKGPHTLWLTGGEWAELGPSYSKRPCLGL